MIRGVDSENGSNCTPVISSLASKNVYYYDFSKLTSSTSINGNSGCYVTLMGSNVSGGAGYRKLGINGKKTIIIK